MIRFMKLSVSALAVAIWVAGCGANDQANLVDGSVFLRATTQARASGTAFESVEKVTVPVVRAAASIRNPTVDEFFDWAEKTYPILFPVKAINLNFMDYVFRYYPATDLILAITGNTVVGMVGVASATPHMVPLGNLSDFTCSVLPSLCVAAPTAVLDMPSVVSGVSEITFMAVCSPTPLKAQKLATEVAKPSEPSLLAKSTEVRRLAQAIANAAQNATVSAEPAPPADKLGDCGGRLTHPAYSHVNGVTTATNQFENYCQGNSDTGAKQIINGSVTYVKTATPAASGPIMNRLVSNSPAGLSIVNKNAAGAVVTSQVLSYKNYVYVPGVPGGDPTSGSPDRMQIDEFQIQDNLTGKSYRQTGYSVTSFDLPGGGTQASISGRGYRSNGASYDMTTTAPLTTNKAGEYTNGVFAFTGAGSSTVVATMVTGTGKLQATMTVGGVPVTGLGACSN